MTRERTIRVLNGWLMLPINLGLLLAGGGLFIHFIRTAVHMDKTGQGPTPMFWVLLIGSVFVEIVAITLLKGHFTLEPNEARVLLLFGSYVGTVREGGFHWTNPFNTKMKISVRARNLEGERLKVNDKRGNPIEIAAVVVWRSEAVIFSFFGDIPPTKLTDDTVSAFGLHPLKSKLHCSEPHP